MKCVSDCRQNGSGIYIPKPFCLQSEIDKISILHFYKIRQGQIYQAIKEENEIEKIHIGSPDKGYRRIRDDLEGYYGIEVKMKNGSSASVERKISNLQSSVQTTDAHLLCHSDRRF